MYLSSDNFDDLPIDMSHLWLYQRANVSIQVVDPYLFQGHIYSSFQPSWKLIWWLQQQTHSSMHQEPMVGKTFWPVQIKVGKKFNLIRFASACTKSDVLSLQIYERWNYFEPAKHQKFWVQEYYSLHKNQYCRTN